MGFHHPAPGGPTSESTETDTTSDEDQTDDTSAEDDAEGAAKDKDSGADSESDGDSDEDGTRLTKEQAMGNEDVCEDKQKAIEERQERLTPDNRPEGAQIDNSEREFDLGTGQFTDHETDEEIGPYHDPSAPDGEIQA